MVNINIDPILFRWGDIIIGWHGLCLMAGLFVAYQVFVYEGRNKGFEHDNLSELALWIAIVGYIGARLLHVLHDWEVYAAQPVSILAVHQGGLKLNGVLIGGTMAIIIYARYKSLSFWSLADAIAVAIPAGEIISRVGCTINGDVWGGPTHSSWGLVYWHPNASIPAHLLGVPTFPVPTLVQVWNIGLLILLLALRKRLHLPGALFLTCMIVYSVGRFMANVWQPEAQVLFGLKQTQIISLAVATLGLGLLLYLKTLPPSARDNSPE